MSSILAEIAVRSPVFNRRRTIYQIAVWEDNTTVRVFRRFIITGLLIALALSPQAHAIQIEHEPATSKTAPSPEDRADINTASIDQLLKLPGMTRTWAARIIRFRPYRGKNELLDRGIVTSSVYDHIKDYIIAHRPAQ
jgi:DNA uptake protein ComE-like DNA-binding protein